MLKEFRLDLHIHTCLSPCADLQMLPSEITKYAEMRNLDGIGICDHNSAENVPAVIKAGKREGLKVFGGMEITSSEEVHILCYFNDEKALMEMQNVVYDNLSGENDENYFGEQLVVDEFDTVLGVNKKLLIGATTLMIREIENITHTLGGFAVASHIDRESFGIIGQLGFIPEELSLDALELSPDHNSGNIEEYGCYGIPFIKSSDAHFLSDIGKTCTTFLLNSLSFSEIVMALRCADGRTIGM
ncbi:PHP domain-containing protein [Candidatus Latescibacterota bacterium]